MKMLSVMLCACMMIITIKAGEPERKFNRGGFFTGLAAGWSAPVFGFGYFLYYLGEKDLKYSAAKKTDWYYQQLYKNANRLYYTGKTLKGVGAGLIIIPLLVNNRELIRDKINTVHNYIKQE